MQKTTQQQQQDSHLNLWDKVEIIVGNESERGTYISRIEGFNRDGIIIAKPEFIAGNRLLTADATVYVQFIRPDALYRFHAKLRGLPAPSSGLVQLCSIGSVERVQRRQFVRVNMQLDLMYAYLKPLRAEGEDNHLWHHSYSINLSASGLLMKGDDYIRRDDLTLIKINKCESLGIPRLIAARCCRIVKIGEKRFAGVEFITDRKLPRFFSRSEIGLLPSQVKEFTANTQNILAKFVFAYQLKERQRD
ncbi:MAG: flagellar brake domain-containing protein [candidate division Zixibacteria bacterium]|nr:flagellar brake domain-containing protein [candidate division Zixibacteria bacterium]